MFSFAQCLAYSYGIANSLMNLGLAYRNLGVYRKAIDYHQQSLPIFKEIGNRSGIANSLNHLGIVYFSLGDYRKAIDYYEQSLPIFKEIGNRSGIAKSLANLGNAYKDLKDYKNAENNLYQAITTWEDIRKLLRNQDTHKVNIFEEQARGYRLLQEVLVAQQKPLQALEISEQGRNRALVEILFRRLSQKPEQEVIPPTPNLTEIQQIAQQQNATLVEYSVTFQEDEIYIWVIPPLSWGEIWDKLRRKKGRRGSRSGDEINFCMISPGKLKDTDKEKTSLKVWSTQPVFVWKGEIKAIEVRHIRSNKLMWSQSVNPQTQSLIYQGEPLQPGEAYFWREALPDEKRPSRVSFRIMKADERNSISTELKELESKLKAQGANPEKIVRKRIKFFSEKGLDSDVFREIYSVKNPSSELKQLIKQIESHDFCSDLISKL